MHYIAILLVSINQLRGRSCHIGWPQLVRVIVVHGFIAGGWISSQHMFRGFVIPPLQACLTKLDESTARRQLKSPRSLSGRSLHLTLVTKWSRSHMTLKIQISRSWPRSNPLSNLRPRVQIEYVCFSSRGNRTTFGWDIANFIFDLENSRSWTRPRSNLMVTLEA